MTGKDSLRPMSNPRCVAIASLKRSWSGKKFYTTNKCIDCHGQQKENEFIAIAQMIPKVN